MGESQDAADMTIVGMGIADIGQSGQSEMGLKAMK